MATMMGKESLTTVGRDIIRLFRQISLVEPIPGDIKYVQWNRDLIVAEGDRFDLWATNLGLFSPNHGSLEYRVRDAEALQSTLHQLLLHLQTGACDVLDYLTEASRAPTSPRPSGDEWLDLSTLDEDSGYDSDENPESDFELLLDGLRDPISRLFKLATKIRNPATRLLSSKSLRYRKVDPESGIDVFEATAPFERDYISSIFLEYRKARALALEAPSAPADAGVGLGRDQDDDPWEPISSVLQLYRSSLAEDRESQLVQRFASANVQRRRQFAFWARHRDRLAQHAADVLQDQRQPVFQAPVASNAERGNETAPPSQSPRQRSVTTATALNPSDLNSIDTRSWATVSEYTPSIVGHHDDVDFPPPPACPPGEKFFECPYCFTICSAAILSKEAWKAHLIHDMRPYQCTYDACRNADQLYDSRQDWIAHENGHRSLWRCPEHPTQLFTDLAAYQDHLNLPHVDDSIRLLPEVISASRSTPDVPDRECPICSFVPESMKELQGHIALHLERFAVFSLPRSPGDELDQNEAGSQNVNMDDDDSRDGVYDLGQGSDLSDESPLSAAQLAKERWKSALDNVFLTRGRQLSRIVDNQFMSSPLRAMRQNAFSKLSNGQRDEAEKILTEILDARKRAFGEEHPRTLSSLSDLAALHEVQAEWGVTAALRQEVLNTQSRTLGSTHPATLTSLANLAVPYRNQGRLTELERLEQRLQEAEDIQRRQLAGGEIPEMPAAEIIIKDFQAQLFDAVRGGDEGLVRQLLRTDGVKPDARDTGLRTPLSWAAGFGDLELTRLFLSIGGVDPDCPDSRGQTPLSWAADCGHAEVCDLLLATGAVDVNSRDASGWTPLAWAASKGYVDVVELLLRVPGVDVDSRSASGLTPLAWAVDNGHEEVVLTLIGSGRADAAFADNQGRSLTDHAERLGYTGIADLLREHLVAPTAT